MEKQIFYIGTREFRSDKKDKTYYVVDYVDLDNFTPYSDFVSALEFTEINKKMKDKHFEKCIAEFSINSFKKVYCSGIK